MFTKLHIKTNKPHPKKSDFITIPRVLYGYLSNFVFREKINLKEFPAIQGYELVNLIRIQGGADQNSVGIYRNEDGKKVIIKSLTYKKNLLAASQLRHEGAMLDLLQEYQYSGKLQEIRFPKLYEVINNPDSISIVMEFVEGKPIAELDTVTKLKLLDDCINCFKQTTHDLPQEMFSKIPKRTKTFMTITFFVYLLFALKQNLKLTGLLLSVAVQFYKYSVISRFQKTSFVLTHKALHEENVIVSGHSATIIDPQTGILAEEFSEIAIIPKFYLKDTGIIEIKKFLLKFLHSEDEVKNFFRLSIYYTIQTLALTGKDYPKYEEAKKYLEILNSTLFKDLLKSLKA
ncbi:MAG TPA: hypothetical protein PLS00_03630 [Niabella sp.]|nr:hypothetical protein [Niabella sp.]HUN01923.1 hypothetical protein [Niabella sp.]